MSNINNNTKNQVKNKKNSGNRNNVERSAKPSFGLSTNKQSRPPVAYGVAATTSCPDVNGRRDLVIRRREFVGSVTNGATTGFALTAVSLSQPGYDINPSVPLMFPWLSRLAGCYERYRFNRLKFDFIPSQSTATAGRFYAAIDYDYDDAVATDKSQLMGNMTAVETPVWQQTSLVCLPAALNRDLPFRYVSCTTRGFDFEPRTSYAGFMMCAFDTTVANCLFDVWVEYDVTLVTPVNDGDAVQPNVLGSGQVIATTNVSVADGAVFGALVSPGSQTVNGPIKVVPLGSFGYPSLNMMLNGGTFRLPTKAIDIFEAFGRGVLTLVVRYIVNGQIPSVLQNSTKLTYSDYAVFNSTGTQLGTVSTSPTLFPVTDFLKTEGCATGASAVAGAEIVSLLTYPLKNLLSRNPTARFIVPFIQNSDAAWGAGFTGFGFSHSF